MVSTQHRWLCKVVNTPEVQAIRKKDISYSFILNVVKVLWLFVTIFSDDDFVSNLA